ncbi:type II CAAX prenyl endopeptidase Rce1 family protein [Rubrivirga sp.]|uniref:CPBP family glutamic-type intramembrane protease n=1 Tax=Rubrivirga sp. TaxID=1885344 RepID=UPI003C72EB90
MPSPADEIASLAASVSPTDAAPPSGAPPSRPTGYWDTTRSATYGFLAALPLFVLYEVGILLANTGPGEIRVGADVWLKSILASIGGMGWAALGAAVVLIGLGVWWYDRNRRPAIVPRYFVLLIAESLAYAIVLAILVGGVVGLLFGMWVVPDLVLAQLSELGLGLQLALSIGAGLYEELVFRVILVGGLFWGLKSLTGLEQNRAYLIAAVLGALVFSGVHHIGTFGDPFTLSVFTFRFLFGLALNAVFLLRGFALAAWTHALYDVLVVTGGL